jgi:hypothetical protein
MKVMIIFFYILAIIPLVIGGYFYYKNSSVIAWEWLAGSIFAFIVAGVWHFAIIKGMTADHETWSGHVITSTFHPMWIEEYTETETETDSKGNTRTRTVTKHRTHPEHWTVECTVGGERKISHAQYDDIANMFGNKIDKVYEWKSGFDGGDSNIYIARNMTNYIYPTTTWKYFENKIKAAPSIYSYAKVPENIKVFNYPQNNDIFNSNRLLGTASQTFNLRTFDQLNTELGPKKKVNLIIIGFGPNSSSEIGKYQEAKFIGGKKNDLVICYGGGTIYKPTWAYVFGWTEKSQVKRELEKICLTENMTVSVLPKFRNAIIQYYTIKDWSKFDYIQVSPPNWSYPVYILVVILTQGIFWYFAMNNNYRKENQYRSSRY